MRLYNSIQEIEHQAHIKSFKTRKKIFLGKSIVAKKIFENVLFNDFSNRYNFKSVIKMLTNSYL